MKRRTKSTLTIAIVGLLCALVSAPGHSKEDKDRKQDKLDRILERLDAIESKLNEPPSATTSATFCISQGRGLELGADWAGEMKLEFEGGLGWAQVGDVKITASPSLPVVVPIGIPPFAVPLPVPTEAKIGVKGGIGRMMDICIDIPITLSPDDEARLADIAFDINAKTGNAFPDKGKFQRRAGRILNYAAVRVPGNQRSIMASVDPAAVGTTDADAEIEFDRADLAIDNLMDNGLGAISGREGLMVFQDGNVRELLATLSVPAGVRTFMDAPRNHIFDGLPDLSGGIRNLTCDELGVSTAMRSDRMRLDGLCNRLESLPTFERAHNAVELGSEITEDIIDAIQQILANTIQGTQDTTEAAKARFCASAVGQRRAFNQYCGR